MDASAIHRRLRKAGVKSTRGLSDKEFTRIEAEFGLTFPPDLKQFLATALPTSPGWVNWRARDRSRLQERLASPYEGMCFDIEHNGFWLPAWGERPAKLGQCFAVARGAVERAPTLIPICSHRFLPDRPRRAGNPVLSVHQTDIIYYGVDLEDYFANEFLGVFGRSSYALAADPEPVEFWSEVF